MTYVDQAELQRNWPHYRDRIRERWPDVPDEELDEFNGNVGALVTAVKNSTGQGYESIEGEISDMTTENTQGGGNSSRKQSAKETAKQRAVQASETASQKVDEWTERAHEQYDHLQHEMHDRYDLALQRTREEPIKALGIAFGIGLFAGLLLFGGRR